jgi:cytochrome b
MALYNSKMEEACATQASTVKVWDIAVRVFHWSLASAIAYEMLFEPGTYLHEVVGYAVLGLVAFRLVWGVIGTKHARFSDFVTSPAKIAGYLFDIMRGHPARHLGHNPAGAAMVLALLLMVTLTAGTGWAMTTDALWGQEWIEELHEAVANGTIILVGLHVAGVILASWQHRENQVKAMVTGRKTP